MGQPSPVEKTVERFKNKPLDFKPGEKFKYSNSGYVLLGYIIERISRGKYETFLKRNIFDPLKMADTGCNHNDQIIKNRAAGYSKRDGSIINAPYIDMSIPTGGGSLYSTVDDISKWDRALSDRKLISGAAYEKMLKSYVTTDWGDEAAYGWFLGKGKKGNRYIGFQGGINGFAAQIMRYTDDGVLIVVLSNYSFAPVGEIEQSLAAIVFGE